ncbi:hypothetical protein BMR1_03g02892 [Babesia microti strain RI]|uniref:Uncharacterized protein n=1 Tax=Babesia microti (strain RI) TaxID=1133968 RepID=A0A1R4ABY9_BABMR|nr:hypothetical protein BMR1_03g02892 [Babesia microti strain RI]SJK86516.1 hypothetical protein BMR1_03g02892 [Babesia microti strain RI]|eukprot:XP_021338666.1 hypothetical protein BMR1_03g02892 [Babesia microti strain RI]
MKFVGLFILLISVFGGIAQGRIIKCSSDLRRCYNECMEKHRTSMFGYLRRKLCKNRCWFSDCLLYPTGAMEGVHPIDRVHGFNT